MLKRVSSIILMLTLIPQLSGCTVVKAVDLTTVERPAAERIHGVVTVDGEHVDFDRPAQIRNDTIYAAVNQARYSVAFDQVEELRVQRTDLAVTAAVVAITVAVVAMALSTVEMPLGSR